MKLPRYLLPHIVRIEPLIGNTAFGDIYGEPVDIPGRVELTQRLIKNAEGRDVVVTAKVLVNETPGLVLATQARLTHKGQIFTIEAINYYSELNASLRYCELWLSP
jgi:hypothetical protein